MTHLTTGKINVSLLREAARRELLQCVDSCVGTKALVWDDVLTGPFNLIAEYTLLKDHDVIKMQPLQKAVLPVQTGINNIIFITRPLLSLVQMIADNIKQFSRRESERGGAELHIIFVPKKSQLCEGRLKELEVFEMFSSIQELCIDLYPVDCDVLTMGLESSFKECNLEKDMTSMQSAARALMTIQALYGIIPSIYGKGKCSKHVYDLMIRMRRELMGSEPQMTPQIDTLLLLDRTVDLISPLVTQLTYEGLIDEIFGINYAIVKLPPDKFNQGKDLQDQSSELKSFSLNSGEELFAELRDKNFNAVGPSLSRKAKTITAQFEERHEAKTVGEMKQFVAKLPHLQVARQSLASHTSIAELVKEVTDTDQFMETIQVQQDFLNGIDTDKAHPHIEECVSHRDPLAKVLRLMCLQSLTNNGLKQKLLDQYKLDIIQTYGYEHIFTLQYLERLGMLRPAGGRTYAMLRKTLRLTIDSVDEQNPQDPAYVHSGYAPVSVRLAQTLVRPGWRAVTEVLAALPGPTIQEVQQLPPGLRKRRLSSGSIQSSGGEDTKVVLVFFLGGCTMAEISALRFLSQQEDAPCEFIVATTKIINGSTLLRSLMEPLTQRS